MMKMPTNNPFIKTSWEWRAWIVLRLMQLLRIDMASFRDSYPYNPHSKKEVEAWWNQKKT